MTTNKHVDPRGPRFGAAITSVLSLIAFYLSLTNQSLAYAILVALECSSPGPWCPQVLTRMVGLLPNLFVPSWLPPKN